MRCLAGLLLVACALPAYHTAAQSACLPPFQLADSAQPAQSIQLYVAALGRADRAHSMLTNIDSASDVVPTLRRASSEARCASQLVSMVAHEADSLTSGLLSLAGTGFEMIALGVDGMRESVIRQVDSPNAARSAREADLTASSVQLIDDGWRNLVTVTLGIVSILKQFDQSGRTMAVAADERDVILREISRQFWGELTEQDARANYARLSAFTIATFLRHPDWKPRQ